MIRAHSASRATRAPPAWSPLPRGPLAVFAIHVLSFEYQNADFSAGVSVLEHVQLLRLHHEGASLEPCRPPLVLVDKSTPTDGEPNYQHSDHAPTWGQAAEASA